MAYEYLLGLRPCMFHLQGSESVSISTSLPSAAPRRRQRPSSLQPSGYPASRKAGASKEASYRQGAQPTYLHQVTNPDFDPDNQSSHKPEILLQPPLSSQKTSWDIGYIYWRPPVYVTTLKRRKKKKSDRMLHPDPILLRGVALIRNRSLCLFSCPVRPLFISTIS